MRTVVGILLGLMVIGGAKAEAQSKGLKRDVLGSFRNWDAVKEVDAKDGTACYMISVPIKSTASRGGKSVDVSRGDIYMMVTHRKKYRIKLIPIYQILT